MHDRRRSEFVKRLSAAGWKALESVQLLLNSVVLDIRDAVAEGGYTESELAAVNSFQTRAEALWRLTLDTDPLMNPALLRERLEQLADLCSGPLDRFGPRIKRAISKANDLEKG